MQSSYNATESAKLLAAYNQQVLLLKNYNRLYNTIQNSYQVVNDALSYIDLHDSSSPNYGGQDPFTIDTYNNEIVPLRQQLLAVKSSQLDIIKSGVDASIDNLNDITATGLADNINAEVLDLMQLDLPVYKDNYNNNVKSGIVSNVNKLVGATKNLNNTYVASSELDRNFIFKVELTSYDVVNRVAILSKVRDVTGIALGDARDLIESAPVIIKQGLDKNEAISIKTQLEAVEAVVSIYPPIPEEYVDPQQSTFTLELTSFGTSKVAVIKVVRPMTGLSLKEAKDLVESAPVTVKVLNNIEDATSARDILITAGATAVIN